MRTKLVNGVRVDLTQAEEAARDAEEAVEAAKPKPPKPINIDLKRAEKIKYIDFLQSNSIITVARANEMKG